MVIKVNTLVYAFSALSALGHVIDKNVGWNIGNNNTIMGELVELVDELAHVVDSSKQLMCT